MTNAVTGIATAYMDSIPMVIITGQVPTHAIGQDAFQECDTVGITRPVRQAQLPGQGRKDLALTMKKAFHIAPHRPARARCVVDIPKDVTAATSAEFEYPEDDRDALLQPGAPRATPGQIKKAVQLLLAAKRPMVYTGGGVILGNASRRAARSWCDLLGFPCTNTLMGLGALSGERPAVPRHAGHARHLRSEHGDAALRRAARRSARASTTA